MDFNTNLFRRPTRSWSTHQLISIYTEVSLRFTSAICSRDKKLFFLKAADLKDKQTYSGGNQPGTRKRHKREPVEEHGLRSAMVQEITK